MDMIDFFVNEYKEDEWDAFTNCFDELDICIEGIPHDIVNSVLTILAVRMGITGYISHFINLMEKVRWSC